MINAKMCSGPCNSDADDYCGMYLEGEECPACAAIKKSDHVSTVDEINAN